MFVLLVIQQTATDGFLPDSLGEWLSALSVSFGFLVLSIRAIRQLEREKNRFDALEKKHDTDITELEKQLREEVLEIKTRQDRDLAELKTMLFDTARDIKDQRTQQIASLRDWTETRLKDQGERIGSVQASCTSNTTSLRERERKDFEMSLQTDANTREVSRLQGMVASVQRELADHLNDAANQRITIENRLATLEALSPQQN